MAKIISIPVADNLTEVKISKNFHALCFASVKAPSEYGTAKIYAYIQKRNGENKIIAKKGTLLADFVTLSAFGEFVITKIGNKFVVTCPISVGNYQLGQDDLFVFEIEGFTTNVLDIYTLEVPMLSDSHYIFDTMVLQGDIRENTFNVQHINQLLFTGLNNIAEVTFTWENGFVTVHDPLELQLMQIDIAPISQLSNDSIASTIQDATTTAIIDVSSINTVKLVKLDDRLASPVYLTTMINDSMAQYHYIDTQITKPATRPTTQSLKPFTPKYSRT